MHPCWSGSWVASGGVLGGLGEVLGVMLAPKMEAKSGKYVKLSLRRAHHIKVGVL